MENYEIELNLYSVLRTNRDRIKDDDELLFVDFGAPFVAIDDLGACRMTYESIKSFLGKISFDDLFVVCVGVFRPDSFDLPIEGCSPRVVCTAAEVVEKFKNKEVKE